MLSQPKFYTAAGSKARSSHADHRLGERLLVSCDFVKYFHITDNPLIVNFQCDAMQSRQLTCTLNLLMRVVFGGKKANTTSIYSTSETTYEILQPVYSSLYIEEMQRT